MFESQTKTKLGSREMSPNGVTIAKFIGDFRKERTRQLPASRARCGRGDTQKKYRKANATARRCQGVAKSPRNSQESKPLQPQAQRLPRASQRQPRLRREKKEATSIFITEGDSAGGSIEKVRNVENPGGVQTARKATQRIRRPPRKNFTPARILSAPSRAEHRGRYRRTAIQQGNHSHRCRRRRHAHTPADAHILLAVLPRPHQEGHVYVLQTPLFRVRNKRRPSAPGEPAKENAPDDTVYCYTDDERVAAIRRFGENAEITRFKGIGDFARRISRLHRIRHEGRPRDTPQGRTAMHQRCSSSIWAKHNGAPEFYYRQPHSGR